MDDERAEKVGQLLDTPDLAGALESDRFKRFLDHVPVAIAVAELQPAERVVYANPEFEGLTASGIVGATWDLVPGVAEDGTAPLRQAIVEGQDHIGLFTLPHADGPVAVDAFSNVIEDDDGRAMFRLVALVRGTSAAADTGLQKRVTEQDVLLRELQHRVKNNLQMITALIRLETRTAPDVDTGRRFDRLAGRVEALALLYQSLSDEDHETVVDLGIYLSQIASAVMRAHAVEGIHLDMRVDTWPVSVNVAMPAGLVVNELLTNALKHAFAGRDGGTITLRSLVENQQCKVIVADDGIGLADGATWPARGKLSALIVQSLRENAKARLDVASAPGAGLKVTIDFTRQSAQAA